MWRIQYNRLTLPCQEEMEETSMVTENLSGLRDPLDSNQNRTKPIPRKAKVPALINQKGFPVSDQMLAVAQDQGPGAPL